MDRAVSLCGVGKMRAFHVKRSVARELSTGSLKKLAVEKQIGGEGRGKGREEGGRGERGVIKGGERGGGEVDGSGAHAYKARGSYTQPVLGVIHMFGWRRQVSALDIAYSALAKQLAKLTEDVSKLSANALRGRIDELEAELMHFRAANRRELGRLWKRVGGESSSEPAVPTDSEFQALLELQRAHGSDH